MVHVSIQQHPARITAVLWLSAGAIVQPVRCCPLNQQNPTFTLEPRPTEGEAGSPGAAIPPNTQQPARLCQACALVDAARSGANKIPHVVELSVVCCFSTGVPDVLLASRPCFLIYCIQYMLMIWYTVQHM
jgi:hypothetical protein